MGSCSAYQEVSLNSFKDYNISEWVQLLSHHPEQGKHCDWNKFDGYCWRELLTWQPQLSKHCDWDKLNGADFSVLLSEHPGFSKHCDWDKLDGFDWRVLLYKQPEFYQHCRWDKFAEHDWNVLLTTQPELCDTEKLQSLAVSKSKKVFDLLFEPSGRVRKLHELKWEL